MRSHLRTMIPTIAFGGLSLASSQAWGLDYGESLDRPDAPWITLSAEAAAGTAAPSSGSHVRLITQEVAPIQPPVAPAMEPSSPLPPAASELSGSLFASTGASRSLLADVRKSRLRASATSVVQGEESRVRATSDAGSLLRKSSAAFGVGTQRRNPIVVDPRVRGSRVGQLAASGSHWIPARIDLDTALNKLDSRVIEDLIVIKGPYSALYGPDLRFFDVELLSAPRSGDGPRFGGSTGLDYQTNGEQWYGRQTVQGADEDWGFRVGYGHRTGSDYEAGNGVDIPASYKSRDVDVAFGYDLTENSSVEFHYLRLDQTDVEFPGQLFDMEYLVTDGYEVTYLLRNQDLFDRLTVDAWYNRTRFEGQAQTPAKRRQFPFLDLINYVGFTDVETASAGYRTMAEWDLTDETTLVAGTDLRLIKQELDEFSSGAIGFIIFDNANSPLPKSQSTNPGLFTEVRHQVDERLSVTTGTRVDFADAELDDDPAKLQALGITTPQASLAEILGTDDFDQSYNLWAAFVTGRYRLDDEWALTFGAGHAERPPSLTELYVAESFLFLLQNGQNTATGDPRLDPERIWQLDVGLELDRGPFRAGGNLFHAWIHDYISFENMQVVVGPAGTVEQVALKYVNTDLATLSGFELYGELDALNWLTCFATMNFVEGRDHSRNGDFATAIHSGAGSPSTRTPGLPRGFFSGIAAGDDEPLPGIPPLESRMGLRLRSPVEGHRWSAEFAARVVDNQDRVASSLLETQTPGFTVWDLRGSWQATDSWLVVAGVENFTDKNYREHLDFRSQNGNRVLQPGINFYVGSQITY